MMCVLASAVVEVFICFYMTLCSQRTVKWWEPIHLSFRVARWEDGSLAATWKKLYPINAHGAVNTYMLNLAVRLSLFLSFSVELTERTSHIWDLMSGKEWEKRKHKRGKLGERRGRTRLWLLLLMDLGQMARIWSVQNCGCMCVWAYTCTWGVHGFVMSIAVEPK